MQLVKLTIFGLLLAACGHGSKKSESLDHQSSVKLKQYVVQGKQLYTLHCSNCHQADGSGLAQLYPPLAKSDYLMADLPRAACMIKNGMTGEIIVNGIKFNQMMPANTKLTPLEIAEILTYITNSWGNEAGITEVTTVSAWLSKCPD